MARALKIIFQHYFHRFPNDDKGVYCGPPHIGVCVGHVDFMLFVHFSPALGRRTYLTLTRFLVGCGHYFVVRRVPRYRVGTWSDVPQ